MDNTNPDKVVTSIQGHINQTDTLPAAVSPQVAGEPNSSKGNKSASLPPVPAEAKIQRTVSGPKKRKARNWDQDDDDEPEEKGEFEEASEDSLKNRQKITVTRKNVSLIDVILLL